MKKIINLLIFLLFLIFLTLICFIGIKMQASLGSSGQSTNCTSTYTKDITLATYVCPVSKADSFKLNGISKADIIFEFLTNDSSITYKAVYKNIQPSSCCSLVKIEKNIDLELPNFQISKEIKSSSLFTFDKQKKITPANSVFLSSDRSTFSNFLYSNNTYYHYRGTEQDIDPATNTPQAFNNIIVLKVNATSCTDCNINNLIGKGSGLLIRQGKVENISWEKSKGNDLDLLDPYNKPILLSEGRTYWVIMKDNGSIVVN